jgi:uncharacterized protein DUF4349
MSPASTAHSRSRRTTTALAVAALLALGGLLAGCSAGSGASDSAQEQEQGQDDSAGSADGAAEGAVADPALAADADAERQVIQTGDIRMTVDDPEQTADDVVALTERAGGRIDDRSEHAATADDVGTAQLTIRLPADEVSGAVETLRTFGTVDQIDLSSQDVTGAAQDLDARIHGLEISVARMEDLLSRANTSSDVIAAEAALAERQTNLEQLTAERARLAEQVALSTLTIALYGPGVAPVETSSEPDSFLDGLVAGWDALVVVVQGFVVVLGVLLPWLALGGLITVGIVAIVRRQQARRPAPPAAAPIFRPGMPMPTGVVAGPQTFPATTTYSAAPSGTGPAPARPASPAPASPQAPSSTPPPSSTPASSSTPPPRPTTEEPNQVEDGGR